MVKLKKRLVFALFLILLIMISGCKGKKDTQKALEEIRTGTQGLTITFLANNPPPTIHAEQDSGNDFDVILELRNKGAFPQPEDRMPAPPGWLYISGYDPNVIIFGSPVQPFSGKPLDGKSTINPNGGVDLITFKGRVSYGNLNVDRYEPTLLATACYGYRTVAEPSVCIDPDPYSTVSQKKVCQVQDISLTSQGAPVTVTKIAEEAFAKKTQFRITMKNIGGGDVIKDDKLDKCGPTGDKIGREDVDKVFIMGVRVGVNVLNCGPFLDGDAGILRPNGYVRLINGEGSVICEMYDSQYGESKTAYTTPMTITLRYGYRNTAERKILVKREPGNIGGEINIPSSGSASNEPVFT